MALYSMQWDRKWRVRGCEVNPIGWQLLDATGRPVGRVLDLLADERLRRVVYALAEIDDGPPVLIDIERISLDADRRQAQVALSHAGLMLLSPALWWRRPAAMRRESMQPVAEGQAERIVVPVYGEALVVEKRPVVIEEIVITKRAGVVQQEVRDTLRREQAEILPFVGREPAAGPQEALPPERRAA